uniref:Uncharacterized protein n=1 Tax=Chlamydomonas euryale TaxID=1486919 RepID=A0A7R9YWH1_9CHLO|mmetsp:Transcript_32301/g.96446  ORF Transcript_32301/g.96446 Transcript_32301/m.96446 type:complete len:343 (+) Transcript_32301:186-1214(+)
MSATMADVVGSNALGLDSDMYTGKEVGRSSESMVSKHQEMMQAEKENIAVEKLSALMPQLGPLVRVAALKECIFDVEMAVQFLRRFSTENEEPLKALQKKRKKLQQERDAAEPSSSESESESASSGDSSDPGRKKRRRGKSSRKSKHKKRGDKDRKKRRRGQDKATIKKAALTSGESFGKYGIIRETDAAAKSSEFILWALEVKKIDIETLPRNDERELFRDYIEDFNTGTLPHRKYYNLEAYNKYKEAKAAAKGGKRTEKKKSAVDDEAELRKLRAEEAAKLREQRMQEALAELKYSDKAKDMKEQEMMRLQMQNAYKTGDKALAEKLMARLAPDDPAKAK